MRRLPAEDRNRLPFRIGWAVRAGKPPTIDSRLSHDEQWRRSPTLNRFFLLGDGPIYTDDVGTEVFVACGPGFFTLVGDFLDLPISSGVPDPGVATLLHREGHQIVERILSIQ